jgi:hypothetical protein
MNRFYICRVPRQSAVHIIKAENMIRREDDAVTPVPDGKFWRPGPFGVNGYSMVFACMRQPHI